MPQTPLGYNSLNPSGALTANRVNKNGQLLAAAGGLTYATVAASQTKQALGTGAIGDVINTITIVPGTTSPAAVGLYDSSSGTEIVVFTGGATSVADLKPFTIELNMASTAGGWKVTTGANVTAVAVGQFTA